MSDTPKAPEGGALTGDVRIPLHQLHRYIADAYRRGADHQLDGALPDKYKLRIASAEAWARGFVDPQVKNGLLVPTESAAPGTLKTLAMEVIEINRANGWRVLEMDDWEHDYRIPSVLALIHSEVSEALEGFREGDHANVAEEIADVMIRCLDMAGGLGIDLDSEIREKLEKNKQRAHKHGGKRI